MKPVQQLSEAINEIMIQKGEECKFYTTHNRYVAKPLAIGDQYVQFGDIFNGARPTRLICYQKSQTRYNGHHQHNINRMIFPGINHFVVKINKTNIVPTITNAKESYMNLVRILNRRHSEMPFDFDHYADSYGLIVMDLSTNKDSYNQMLPNSTAAVVSVEMKYTQALAAAQQVIFIGEFCNQLSIGYKTAAHKMYDF